MGRTRRWRAGKAEDIQVVQPVTGGATGKGRPTPKRSEAETQRRKRAVAPATRKEAYQRMREDSREERQRRRRGIASGDARALPRRDQGPARAWVRDYVDGRRSVGEFFFLLAIVVLVLSTLPFLPESVRSAVFVLWAAMLVTILVDSVVLSVRLKRAMRGRFTAEEMKGATLYGIMRSTQMRWLRMPKPQRSPGSRPS